jgi:hypothetical protein
LEDKKGGWIDKIRAAGVPDEDIKHFLEDKMKLASHKWDHRNLVGDKVASKNALINATKPGTQKSVFINPAN